MHHFGRLQDISGLRANVSRIPELITLSGIGEGIAGSIMA